MADNTGDLEKGDPFGTIDFHVVNQNRQAKTFSNDCSLKILVIRGLKVDLADKFGVEGVQTWTYNGEILEDDKSLWDYGIDGTKQATIRVSVSRFI